VHVVYTGDRPVQTGWHFHFFDATKQLAFDSVITIGFCLNIAAGTAVRFKPGEEKTVTLVSFGGSISLAQILQWKL
jgi:urease beta subunit